MDPENAAIAAEQNAANKRAVAKAARERDARAWKGRRPEPRSVEVLTDAGTLVEIARGWTNGEHTCAKLAACLPVGQGMRLHCPITGRFRSYQRGADVHERTSSGWVDSPRVLVRDEARMWATFDHVKIKGTRQYRLTEGYEGATEHALLPRESARGPRGHVACGAEGVIDARFAYDWFEIPGERQEGRPCPACAALVRADREHP